MTLAHRLFLKMVLIGLENLVSGMPYLHQFSHPTWHSWTSSWSLSMRVPQSAVHAKHLIRASDATPDKNVTPRSQFNTKVVVRDESISVSGEGAPNVVALFRGGEQVDVGSRNSYDCNLEDLPMILLQQVASQVVLWLHEEALVVEIKATRDFLALSFELTRATHSVWWLTLTQTTIRAVFLDGCCWRMRPQRRAGTVPICAKATELMTGNFRLPVT